MSHRVDSGARPHKGHALLSPLRLGRAFCVLSLMVVGACRSEPPAPAAPDAGVVVAASDVSVEVPDVALAELEDVPPPSPPAFDPVATMAGRGWKLVSEPEVGRAYFPHEAEASRLVKLGRVAGKAEVSVHALTFADAAGAASWLGTLPPVSESVLPTARVQRGRVVVIVSALDGAAGTQEAAVGSAGDGP